MKYALRAAISLFLLACGSESSPGTTVDVATSDTAVTTCNVDGVDVAAGAPAPNDACQICDPDAAGGFVDAPDGAACPGGVCSAGVCQASCVIDGVTVSDGAANPSNPCQSCDVSASTTGWSSAADATVCAKAAYCLDGACVSGCLIDGAVVAEAGVNPENACQRCSAATSLSAWSNADDGTACTGGLCNEGACTPGCFISGAFVAAGESPEGSACQICDPAQSTTAWSPVADGAGCTGGGCAAGECAPGCVIGGAFVAPDAVDPTEPCRVCVPDLSTSDWSPKPDGDACGSDLLCWTGVCSEGCFIDGAWYSPDALNPGNACQRCTPATSKTAWTALADGADCGDGQICHAATCGLGCIVDGAFVAAGGTVGTACQRCEPGQTTAGTVAAPDGTACGDGLVCSAGACDAGCYIDGAIVSAGALRDVNPCERCQPAASTTSWTAVSNGDVCGAGQVCWAAACVAGCAIEGVLIEPNGESPGQPCLRCEPAVATSAWTARDDGTTCGAGDVCIAGTCETGCYIDGTFTAQGATDGPCLLCSPDASTAAWTPVPDGSPCALGQVCDGGSCETACYLEGTIVAPGTEKSDSACLTCQPGVDTTAWSPRANGSDCGVGQVCSDAICLAGCYVDGVYRTADEAVGSACQLCKPMTSTSMTTSEPDGTPCAAGQVCEAGSCNLGCFIDGAVADPDAAQPGNVCRTCQPDAATTDWSSVDDGTVCAAGKVCDGGACTAGCFIDGQLEVPGTVDPADPCGQCDPTTSTSAWSDRANGTDCGAGAFCSAGACSPGCWIGGSLVSPGAANPQNVCERCEPDVNETGWTAVELGTACAAGKVCNGNVCAASCFISGVIETAAALNPDNACENCAPGATTTDWTNLPDGSSCGPTGICTNGKCSDGCFISGVSYSAGDANPANPCQLCQPVTSKSAWTTRANGSVCGDGSVCVASVCKAGCYIDGAYAAPDAKRASFPCQACAPATSTSSWSNLGEGSACGTGQVCNVGTCKAACYIAGTIVNAGAADPSSSCRTCNNLVSTTAWTPKTNGTSCATGSVCNAGECAAGCWISGQYRAAGTMNGTCQTCAPEVSTTAWSPLQNGTSCGLAQVCSSGTCTSACYISGAVVAQGTAEPGNPCRTCDPVQSTTDWSGLPDGTGCGTGKVCSNATCKTGCYVSNAFLAPGETVGNACQVCDPTKNVKATSNAADGTACGTGLVCGAGQCNSQCYIAGALKQPGTSPIGNTCQSCQPLVSTTAYSNVSAGTSCGTGKVCDEGSCLAKCFIDGAVQASGAVDPQNPCGVCTPGTSTTSWSNRANGTDCGAGVFCQAGTCAAGCWISGALKTTGTANPLNACQKCDPATLETDWSTVALGSSCGAGKVCNGTTCQTACFIEGAIVTSTTKNPLNACEACTPASATTSYTVLANGTSCSATGICTTGQCSDGCFISNTSYPAGALDPSNPCRICQPASSKTSWTTKSNGSTCGATEVCTSGTCTTGCYISGIFRAPNSVRSGYACQLCDPASSLTSWSSKADGSTCGSNQVCAAGTCNTACFINGALVNVGAVDPTSVCRTCQNTLSVTSYSNKTNGTSCGTGQICNVGVCSAGCLISNVYYASGALDPANSCRACTPGTSTTSFTTKPSGSQCTTGTCLDTTCIAAPTLTSVAPACTPNDGGRTITLTGANFAPGAIVTVAGLPATGVVVTNTQSVKAVTPATPNVIGKVAVTIANAYGNTTSSTSLFGLYGPFGFGTPTATSTGTYVPYSIEVGDVDGDGKTDLVYSVNGVITIKREGTAAATFGATSTYTGCAFPGPLAIADVTEDGLADVLVACTTGVHVLKGVMGAAPVYFAAPSLGYQAFQLETGNFDGDAFVDLAITVASSNLVRIYRGNGDATFTAGATINYTDVASYLTIGDVSGDGVDDVVAANHLAAKVRIAINSGTATFGTPVATTVTALQTIQIVKLDGDARGDILVSSTDSSVSASFFLSLGNGSLGPRVNLTGGGLYGASAADFNGDTIADALVSGGTGMRVFPGVGDGTFSCVFEVPLSQGSYDLIPGDFDGNGALDIVTNNPSFKNYVLIMNGN